MFDILFFLVVASDLTRKTALKRNTKLAANIQKCNLKLLEAILKSQIVEPAFWLGVKFYHTTKQCGIRIGDIMDLEIPRPMKKEHEELHNELKKGIKEKGKVGEAARAVAKILHPHFVKEEEYAMPPLGLLTIFAKGRVSTKMREALVMTNKLQTNLDEMLKEHKEIVAALKKLVAAAKKENKLEYVRFADKLILHAQTEEQVYYPASLLIGKYLKLKLKKQPA